MLLLSFPFAFLCWGAGNKKEKERKKPVTYSLETSAVTECSGDVKAAQGLGNVRVAVVHLACNAEFAGKQI